MRAYRQFYSAATAAMLTLAINLFGMTVAGVAALAAHRRLARRHLARR